MTFSHGFKGCICSFKVFIGVKEFLFSSSLTIMNVTDSDTFTVIFIYWISVHKSFIVCIIYYYSFLFNLKSTKRNLSVCCLLCWCHQINISFKWSHFIEDSEVLTVFSQLMHLHKTWQKTKNKMNIKPKALF